MWFTHKKKVVRCEERVYSVRRVTSAVAGQGVWCREKVCIKEMSHLQYKEKKCSVQEGLHLQYDEKVLQYEEKMYIIRIEHL